MSRFEESHRLRRETELGARASGLRKSATPSEQALWNELRAGRVGVVFRRQMVVRGFIADFAAPSLKLIVEVDGGSHEERRSRDASRDRKLRRLGYRVLRLEAEVVTRELPKAVELVRAAVEELRAQQGS